MITTCPKCGKAYEELSREEADSPTRLCMECFKEEVRMRIAIAKRKAKIKSLESDDYE